MSLAGVPAPIQDSRTISPATGFGGWSGRANRGISVNSVAPPTVSALPRVMTIAGAVPTEIAGYAGPPLPIGKASSPLAAPPQVRSQPTVTVSSVTTASSSLAAPSLRIISWPGFGLPAAVAAVTGAV